MDEESGRTDSSSRMETHSAPLSAVVAEREVQPSETHPSARSTVEPTFAVRQLQGGAPVELCWGTNTARSSLRHLHEDYRFGIAGSGHWACRYRGIDHIVTSGHLQYAEPGETSFCAFDGVNDSSYRVIVISPAALQAIYEDITGRPSNAPHFRDHIIADPAIWQSFACTHAELTSPMSRLEASSLLRDLVVQLLARNLSSTRVPRCTRHSSGLEIVRSYLHDQIAANPSLEELAAIAGLSPFHFSRLFRQTFGLPPHAYQNHLRIERAKELLKGGNSAAAIAHDLGFSDQPHFIRHFRRQVGVTPQRYLDAWLHWNRSFEPQAPAC
ncbi:MULTISPECIES: helix-turn-helix domain-containing protein [Chelativorans]|nr:MULTISPECIES: AraC family transcriptional regulator [Chelativorans]